MAIDIITVPGLNGSDDDHWQTWLELQLPNSSRVTGIDWQSPQVFVWAEAIEKHIDSLPGQVMLVAHSFGCLASAMVASWRPEKVAGLILVAPAAPERFSLNGKIDGQQQHVDNIAGLLPDRRIDTLGLLVASKTDPWMSYQQAEKLGQLWELAFYNAGDAGHINSESGYGEWLLIKDFVSALSEAVEPLPGDEVHQLGRWNSHRRPRANLYGWAFSQDQYDDTVLLYA